MKHYSKVQKRKIIKYADRTSDVKAGREFGRSAQTIGRWRQELKMPHIDFQKEYFEALNLIKGVRKHEK